MNDLVPKAQSEDKMFTGAGPLDGVEDFAGNVDNVFEEGKNVDWAQLGIDGAGMALDAAGTIVDPLGTLASSAVGWIIENVDWVREPFDNLMGDPAAVQAVAQTWGNIANHLNQQAGQYASALKQVEEWQGQSGAAYKGAAADLHDHIVNASAAAASASNKIKWAGVGVASTRALVRDLLAELAGTLIVWGLGALATSVVTCGGSVAAFIARAVAKAIEIAGRMAQYLKKLFTALDKLGGLAESATGTIRKRTDDLASAPAGSAAPTSPSRLDNFTNAANAKADSVRQWGATKAEPAYGMRKHGTDLSEVGHDSYDTLASQTSDGPLANTRLGRIAQTVDEYGGKSFLDGQGWARVRFSGDLGHVAPGAGDAVAPVKEAAKETNKAFGQDPSETPHTSSEAKAQPHLVDPPESSGGQR